MKKNEVKFSTIKKKLGAFLYVEPIYSNRSNEAVRNQYCIAFEHGCVFQSYHTFIGARVDGKLYLSEEHNCSTTTSKYCTIWSGYDPKERRKGLENGTIHKLVD